MKWIFFLVLGSILTSCGMTVSFNQPQPKDGKRLEEFPEELRGTWTADDGDFFTIDATGTTDANVVVDSLNNSIDTSYRYTPLSDSLRIYQGGKYYVYNEQSSNGSWSIVIAEVNAKGDIYFYFSDDVKLYSKFKGLTVDSASYKVEYYVDEIDELVTYDTTVYEPSIKQLSSIPSHEINWVYFNGQIRIKDLRKIAVRENLSVIYKNDGTLESIKEEEEEED